MDPSDTDDEIKEQLEELLSQMPIAWTLVVRWATIRRSKIFCSATILRYFSIHADLLTTRTQLGLTRERSTGASASDAKAAVFKLYPERNETRNEAGLLWVPEERNVGDFDVKAEDFDICLIKTYKPRSNYWCMLNGLKKIVDQRCDWGWKRASRFVS